MTLPYLRPVLSYQGTCCDNHSNIGTHQKRDSSSSRDTPCAVSVHTGCSYELVLSQCKPHAMGGAGIMAGHVPRHDRPVLWRHTPLQRWAGIIEGYTVIDGRLALQRYTHLEATHERLIDAHHSTGIIKFSTVVGRRKEGN